MQKSIDVFKVLKGKWWEKHNKYGQIQVDSNLIMSKNSYFLVNILSWSERGSNKRYLYDSKLSELYLFDF